MKNKEISVYHQCALVEMESRQHSISLLTVSWLARNAVIECMMLHNMIEDEDNLVADEVSILNCSRDPIFIKHCL